MSYLIAAASSDGMQVNLSFHDVTEFRIYRVTDGVWQLEEIRRAKEDAGSGTPGSSGDISLLTVDASGTCIREESHECGCGEGASKAESILDCRALIATKVGMRARKVLDAARVSVFELEGAVPEILDRIVNYYDRMDRHINLRNYAKDQKQGSNRSGDYKGSQKA